MMRRPRTPRPRAAAWPALLLLAGCAAAPPDDSPPTPLIRAAGESPAPTLADGLESLWWVADDSDGAATRALAAFAAEPVPINPAEIERLRAAGLRVLCVPVASLDALRAATPAGGPVERRWIGQATDWTVLLPASNWPAGLTALAGPDEPVTLPPGQLRLLVRAWTIPADASAPAPADGDATPGSGPGPLAALLRVDVIPQMFDARPRFERLLEQAERGTLEARPINPGGEGLLLEALRVSAALPPGRALVLVADAPEADWSRLAEISDRTGRAETPSTVGPQTRPLPTLGQAMLTGTTPSGSRIRIVAALIPRVPETFRLLP